MSKRGTFGFTVVELSTSLVSFAILALTAYSAFRAHVSTEFNAVRTQQVDQKVVQAIQTLQADLQSFGFEWRGEGVAPMFWQMGIGAGGADALSFAIPTKEKPRLLQVARDVYGSELFSTDIPIRPVPAAEAFETMSDARLQTRLLVRRAGQWALGRARQSVIEGAWFKALRVSGLHGTESAGVSLIADAGSVTRVFRAGMPKALVWWYSAPEVNPQYLDLPAGESTIQSVLILTYELVDVPPGPEAEEAGEGPKRYLARRVNGVRTLLAPVDMLKIRVDDPTGKVRGEADGQSANEDYSDVRSVRADLTVRTTSGDARNFSLQVSLAGAPAADRKRPGGGQVARPMRLLATHTAGKLWYEVYADGKARSIVPAINFGADAATSTGEIAVLDEAGTNLGTIPLRLDTGESFLPTAVTGTSGIRPGGDLVIGGYAERVSNPGLPVPALAVLSRCPNGRIDPACSTSRVFTLTGPSDLRDTNSVTLSPDGRWALIAPVTKVNPTDRPAVFATRCTEEGCTPAVKLLDVAQAVPGTSITALGPGGEFATDFSQSADPTRPYIAMVVSNSTPLTATNAINYDGFVALSEIDYGSGETPSLKTPKIVAMTNYKANGVSADAHGNLLVAGRNQILSIPRTQVAKQVQPVDPELGMPEPPTIALAPAVQNAGKWYYANDYRVTNLAPDSGYASYSIYNLNGFVALPTDDSHLLVAATNFDPSGTVRNSALTVTQQYAGVDARLTAALEPAGTKSAIKMLPFPGRYDFSGSPDVIPGRAGPATYLYVPPSGGGGSGGDPVHPGLSEPPKCTPEKPPFKCVAASWGVANPGAPPPEATPVIPDPTPVPPTPTPSGGGGGGGPPGGSLGSGG